MNRSSLSNTARIEPLKSKHSILEKKNGSIR